MLTHLNKTNIFNPCSISRKPSMPIWFRSKFKRLRELFNCSDFDKSLAPTLPISLFEIFNALSFVAAPSALNTTSKQAQPRRQSLKMSSSRF